MYRKGDTRSKENLLSIEHTLNIVVIVLLVAVIIYIAWKDFFAKKKDSDFAKDSDLKELKKEVAGLQKTQAPASVEWNDEAEKKSAYLSMMNLESADHLVNDAIVTINDLLSKIPVKASPASNLNQVLATGTGTGYIYDTNLAGIFATTTTSAIGALILNLLNNAIKVQNSNLGGKAISSIESLKLQYNNNEILSNATTGIFKLLTDQHGKIVTATDDTTLLAIKKAVDPLLNQLLDIILEIKQNSKDIDNYISKIKVKPAAAQAPAQAPAPGP